MRYLARYPRVAAFIWAVLILLLCATPGSLIPDTDWLDLLSFDKLVHASLFFVLCSLLFYASTNRIEILCWVVLALVYGFVIEYLQANYFSERSADLMDVMANAFGVLMAAIFIRRVRSYLLRFI